MILDHMSAAEESPRISLLLVTVGITVFMASLDLAMVAISLPSLARDLGISSMAASWVMMASLLVPCSFPVVFLRLGERKGFRLIFAAGCLVFASGSLLCGIAVDAGMLIGSRLLVGVGASMSAGLATAMVMGKTPDSGMRKGAVIIAVSSTLGFVLGPVLGVFITDFVSWHGIFFIDFLVAIAGFVWGVLSLRWFDPFGTLALKAHLRGSSPPALAFVAQGAYRCVRHPLYLCMLLLIWSAPRLSTDRLLFNVLWTAWIVVGTKLEERDLLADFGEIYRRYQLSVPMLIPSPRLLRRHT